MPYLRDRAIILRSETFREHDRRIVMFGIQHGLIEAVARGASAKEAKQGGHLLPMSEADVLVAKGAAFDKLAVAKSIHPRMGLRRHLGALAVGGAFCDFFYRMQRPGIVDAESYMLLRDVLDVMEALPEDPSPERAQLLYAAAVLKLLDRVGFAPPLSGCASCREAFVSSATEVWFIPTDGAFLCSDCYRTVRRAFPNAAFVSIQTLTLLRFLRREPLQQALILTAPTETFQSVASLVALLLQQAPLSRAPHGHDTIGMLLRER